MFVVCVIYLEKFSLMAVHCLKKQQKKTHNVIGLQKIFFFHLFEMTLVMKKISSMAHKLASTSTRRLEKQFHHGVRQNWHKFIRFIVEGKLMIIIQT